MTTDIREHIFLIGLVIFIIYITSSYFYLKLISLLILVKIYGNEIKGDNVEKYKLVKIFKFLASNTSF